MSPFQNCSPSPSRAARSKMMSVSGRASPGGGTTAGRNWISDCASGADLEADLQPLALEGRGDRQHDIGQFGGRVHEQIGMGVEVQLPRAPRARAAVGMGQQHVGAEADQRRAPGRACPPGSPGRGRGVVTLPPARRPERALGEAEGRRHRAGRRQILAGDRRGRRRRRTARCRRAGRNSRSARRAATSRAPSA